MQSSNLSSLTVKGNCCSRSCCAIMSVLRRLTSSNRCSSIVRASCSDRMSTLSSRKSGGMFPSARAVPDVVKDDPKFSETDGGFLSPCTNVGIVGVRSRRFRGVSTTCPASWSPLIFSFLSFVFPSPFVYLTPFGGIPNSIVFCLL